MYSVYEDEIDEDIRNNIGAFIDTFLSQQGNYYFQAIAAMRGSGIWSSKMSIAQNLKRIYTRDTLYRLADEIFDNNLDADRFVWQSRHGFSAALDMLENNGLDGRVLNTIKAQMDGLKNVLPEGMIWPYVNMTLFIAKALKAGRKIGLDNAGDKA